jgi:hypothetical protein
MPVDKAGSAALTANCRRKARVLVHPLRVSEALAQMLRETMPLNDPRRWRRRAAETRSLAAQLKEPETKRLMLEMAMAYERLAVQVREQLGADGGETAEQPEH